MLKCKPSGHASIQVMAIENPVSVSDLAIRLSIIIPIRDMVGRLENLTKSLKSASTEIQIVVVIDGNDNELECELLNLVKSKFDNLNVLIQRGDFNSPGLARNYGMRFAVGDWITFWDADDIGNATTLMQLIKGASTEQQYIKSSYVKNIEGTQRRYLMDAMKESNTTVLRQPGIWRYAFRRDFIGSICFSHLRLGEDQVFLSEVLGEKATGLVSSEVTYQYNTGVPNSLTNDSKKHQNLLILSNFLQVYQNSRLLMNRNQLKRLQARTLVSLIACKEVELKLKIRYVFEGLRSNFKETITFIPLLVFDSTKERHQERFRDSQKHEVVLAGGLGNQLFQISHAIYRAKFGSVVLNIGLANPRKSNNGIPEILETKLPDNVSVTEAPRKNFLAKKFVSVCLRVSCKKNLHLFRVLLEFFGTLYFSASRRRYTKVHLGQGVGDFAPRRCTRRNLYIGYFQSSTWASNSIALNSLRSLKFGSEEFSTLMAEAKRARPLIVHIRLGDYFYEPGIGVLDKSYYQEALRFMLPSLDNREIWLFSDEPKKARDYLDRISINKVKVIEGLESNPSESFELMRYGSAFIIGNSTFSWWAANMRYQTEAPVVAPKPWFRVSESPKGIIPFTWKTISGWTE